MFLFHFFAPSHLVFSGKFVLHTVQLLPRLVVRTLEQHKMFNLAENGEWEVGRTQTLTLTLSILNYSYTLQDKLQKGLKERRR